MYLHYIFELEGHMVAFCSSVLYSGIHIKTLKIIDSMLMIDYVGEYTNIYEIRLFKPICAMTLTLILKVLVKFCSYCLIMWVFMSK